MKRREFITVVCGAAAWPLSGTMVARPLPARAQQPAAPVVAFINGGTAGAITTSRNAGAFSKGLSETGYVEGRNVKVEFYWLEGHYDRLPTLLTDLVRRRVALIATPGSTPEALAAKAATSSIPIVFGVAEDAVQLGLVASLARPGGNATGVNFFVAEVTAKRLRLLQDLVPKATRVAVLINPANASASNATTQDIRKAASGMGLEIHILDAATSGEIDAVFAGFARERPDALFVAPDGFFSSRAVQFALLAARDRIPATYSNRDTVEVGGLMSYGTNITDMFHQVGVYAGRILKGEKPLDMPVLQSTKFVLAINLQAARALGMEVPPDVLSIADEVIE
jgi:putative ABC transport system substrate-binding protein